MMKNIFIVFLIVLSPCWAYSQTNSSYCDTILKKANSFLKKDSIEKAIKELKNLELCDYNNKLQQQRMALQADIFNKIQKQKERAETSQRNAIGLAKKAENNLSTALAYYLIWKAKTQVETDPTLALKYAMASDSVNSVIGKKDPSIEQEKNKIFSDNSFYKLIIDDFDKKYSPLSMARSPHGDTILIGYSDGNARMYYPLDTLNNYDTSFVIFEAHSGGVTSVAFSPDGKKILTGSNDSTACLWKLNGDTIKIFRGHKDAVTSVAFSPDGKKILTGSNDSTACLWDLEGNAIKIFRWHKDAVTSVAFSPTGNAILTGSNDKTAYLRKLNGDSLQVFKGQHRSGVTSVAFSRSGDSILTGSKDKTARMWDLNGKVIREFKGHMDAVTSLAFSPNGKEVLTGSDDKTARLWDFNGNMIKEFKAQNVLGFSVGKMYAVAFSYNGKSVLTGAGNVESYTNDNSVRSWYLNRNKSFKNNSGSINTVAFSGNGKTFLAGFEDGSVQLFDFTGNKIQEFRGHTASITSVKFSPDENAILTGSNDSTARLWNLQGDTIKVFRGDQEAVTSVAFSTSGKGDTILTGSQDGKIRLWDRNGKLLNEIKNNSEAKDTLISEDTGLIAATNTDTSMYEAGKTPGPVESVDLTGSNDGIARLWNLNGEMINEFRGHNDSVISVALSPSGDSILTGSKDSTARLWNMEGKTLKIFRGHKAAVTSVSFSPDGSSILTGSNDSTVTLWSIGGDAIKIFRGHKAGITSVAISPSGDSILTGSKDSTARLWNLEGETLEIFRGHTNSVTSVAFSPGGNSILTGSNDSTACLWNLAGDTLKVFRGQKDIVFSVSFAPTEDTAYSIVITTKDNFRLWDFNSDTIANYQNSYVLPLDYSPSTNRILTGYVKSIHNSNWKPEKYDYDYFPPVTSVTFSPNGKIILSGDEEGNAILWNLKGKVLSLTKHNYAVTSVAFSPSGDSMLTWSRDGTTNLLDLNGKIIKIYKDINDFGSFTSKSYPGAFSYDGKSIVCGSGDGSVRLWDASSHDLYNVGAKKIFSSDNMVYSVAFSPDGETIIAGYDDGTIRLWDVNALSLKEAIEQNLIETFQHALEENNYGLSINNSNKADKIDIDHLTTVNYCIKNNTKCGSFKMTVNKKWTETNTDGSFNYIEINRDDSSINLYDPDRGMKVILDLKSKKILSGDSYYNSDNWGYIITSYK
ncbi:hypothetical protein BH10BAC2_BH10BAC2_22760 [soil metagenome]